MRYKLKCSKCEATCWVQGSYDPETNAAELDDKSPWDWEDGNDLTCTHEEFEIVGEDDASEFPLEDNYC